VQPQDRGAALAAAARPGAPAAADRAECALAPLKSGLLGASDVQRRKWATRRLVVDRTSAGGSRVAVWIADRYRDLDERAE
jgi:hypothetical protein